MKCPNLALLWIGCAMVAVAFIPSRDPVMLIAGAVGLGLALLATGNMRGRL